MAAEASDEPPPAARSGTGAVVQASDGPPSAGWPAEDGAVVLASDETTRPTVGCAGLDTGRWAALAAAVLRDEGVAAGELGLRFVDPGPMAELNAAHMGASGPTDVLAFPIDAGDSADGPPQPSGPARLLGDVVVCPSYAAAQAADRDANLNGEFDDELALLVVHGVLHVLGYDHSEDADAARMQARERALLAALHRAQ